MNLAEHPTVRQFQESQAGRSESTDAPKPLDRGWLRQLCLDCGADDAGLVEINRPALDDQRADILHAFPATRTLLSFVCRMNREPIRSRARSVANVEFHHTGDHANEVARKVVTALERLGVRALNPAMGFPMEMERFSSGKIWIVSHKPVAVAAGLGHMGIHRNVIHPKLGNFILPGTVLIGAEATAYDQPISYNPCLECKLCVAACPVGAIAPEPRHDRNASTREALAALLYSRPMSDVTRILDQIHAGDPTAAQQLLPLVYNELRKLAAQRLAEENPGQTLQGTALVHEAYLRLVDVETAQPWNGRGHFFAAAAEAMRRILVEAARKRRRIKRGGDRQRLDLDAVQLSIDDVPDDLLDLDDALTELARTHPEKAELVKLRFFAGLTVDEAAEALGVAPATADRHWAFARAWLYRRIVGDEGL